MARRLTYEVVKKSFEMEGYTLLSRDYKNSKTSLEYRCPLGHKHSIIWNSWANGRRCPYCVGNARLNIDYVRSSFEKEGYILISNYYKNAYTKLDYVCPNGHKHNITWHDWRSGYRCLYCSDNSPVIYSDVKKSFNSEGYVLINQNYVNNHTKLKYICPNGYKHNITWANWSRGKRCPCYGCKKSVYLNHSLKMSGKNHPNWKGGKSFEEYCQVWKDQEFKIDIRGRDDNRCLNPYCDSNKSDDLTVHHIDYNKKNCHPSNLITVCRACNSRANKDREWHRAWYQAIIKRRYNYEN